MRSSLVWASFTSSSEAKAGGKTRHGQQEDTPRRVSFSIREISSSPVTTKILCIFKNINKVERGKGGTS